MKKIRVTYFALAALVSAASCSKEAAEPGVYDWADGEIYFKTSLTDVVSRADDMTLDHLESFQVTCFNTGDLKKDADGFIAPYFEDAKFIRQQSPVGITYISSPDEGPRDWPTKSGVLKFFAFSPSRSVMAADNSAITDENRKDYFNLINSSIDNGNSVMVGYQLGKVRINPDIASQFDFVTAEASGERWKDFSSGVNLTFSHQLAQIEIKAWGASADTNFEIAGVRLGNPVVEGTFVFSDDTESGSAVWSIAEDALTDKVEYIYRGVSQTATNEDEIEFAGDRIFYINEDEHNTPESAESLMGRGGCAMVLPTVNQKWQGLADPNIGATPYVTDKMYFSILMRVTDSNGKRQIYPYTDATYEMKVIHYAVDESGTILARVYPGKTEDEFFADRDLNQPYVIADGVEIRQYGWAAVPVDANWSAGKRYVYTLDYSEGIGVHDPEDPEPGKLIGGKKTISWGVTVGNWSYAAKNEDYDPDINVP